MGPLNIALALYDRQRMLCQRHCQRRLWDTGAVAHFRHEQIIARQQRLLQRTRWNHVVLEEELVDEIHGHEGEHQSIYPRHNELHRPFGFLPPLPLDLLGDIDIKDKRYHQQSPPRLHPVEEQQIQYQHDDELRPLYLRIEFFLLFHLLKLKHI